jgi:bifunctional NMN adenylyltransferase/nudix hydrolase
MPPTYDHAVVIGRFSPCDNGHVERLGHLAGRARRVLILVAAADKARESRLPWTADERETLLRAGLGAVADDFVFGRVDDHPYDPRGFAEEVTLQLEALRGEGPAGRVCVVSRAGDIRRDALDGLPADWERITPPPSLDRAVMLETLYGDAAAFGSLAAQVPDAVFQRLEAFRDTAVFAAMAEEHRYVEAYKKSWEVAPYPPVFVAADVLAIQSDPEGMPHILLVRRGGIPGKGQWAMPGGYLDPREELVDGALRELREETGLTLSDAELKACLKRATVFADPDRASRGRVITHNHHFVLPAGPLPVVAGADDAEHAVWLPLSDLPPMRGEFFEDHYAMIEYVLERET